MIFISYAWRDRRDAERLATDLDRRGVPYWIDSERLDTHRPLEPQIERAIAISSALLVVDTPASRASRWVSYEKLAA